MRQSLKNDDQIGKVLPERRIRQLPGWATWTPDEASTWINENVTDLQSAKTALRNMAKMIVNMRDLLVKIKR